MGIELADMLFGAAAIAVAPNALVALFDLLQRYVTPMRSR